MTTLLRRVERLERSLGVTKQAHEEFILDALDRLSAEEVQLLIDGAMARRRGRAFTEPECAAQHAYRGAVCECRGLRGELTTVPFGPLLIGYVALLIPQLEDSWSHVNEDYFDAMSAQEQGLELTPVQMAAIEKPASLVAALYRRIGFRSEDEFMKWFGKPGPRERFNYASWSDHKLHADYGKTL